MSNPILTAAILVEATGAALNNAGSDTGKRLDNAVVVKQIRVGRNAYPYISGQAVRRWWREVLYADFDWKPSPVTREPKSAYTTGNPIAYEDDDVFGYMAAKKAKKQAKKAPHTEALSDRDDKEERSPAEESPSDDGGTQRRISPLKNSILVSVLPQTITSDFGHFSRDLPVDNPNMVPFEHEHYTTLLQGVFTLSLKDVGRFECGLMRDLPLHTAVEDGLEIEAEADGRSRPRVLRLPQAERQKRIEKTIRALGRLRFGANLTRNLSDVTPVAILAGFLDGGNAPFQNLFTPAGDACVSLNLRRLTSVIQDYQDRFLCQKTLYFGYRPGVLANEEEVLEAFCPDDKGGSHAAPFSDIADLKMNCGTPGSIITAIASAVQHGDVPLE